MGASRQNGTTAAQMSPDSVMADQQELDAWVGVPHFATSAPIDQTSSYYLPEPEYHRALQALVITCVDVLLVHAETVLLGQRRQPPRLGWWLIGGRMRVGEAPVTAMQRKLYQEANLSLTRERLQYLGAYSSHFRGVDAATADAQRASLHPGLHSVNLTYFAVLAEAERQAITLIPSEYDDARWFKLTRVEADLQAQTPDPPTEMDAYLQRVLWDLRNRIAPH